VLQNHYGIPNPQVDISETEWGPDAYDSYRDLDEDAPEHNLRFRKIYLNYDVMAANGEEYKYEKIISFNLRFSPY
jgi:hypothetical protein